MWFKTKKEETPNVIIRFENGLEVEYPSNEVRLEYGFLVLGKGDNMVVWPAHKIHSTRFADASS